MNQRIRMAAEERAGRIGRKRTFIIGAALLALFLGALDALVMTAAMPTVIADLGGLHLYAWSYSSYFLARAVSLPVFGKLSDLFATKRLFLFSISLFIVSSVAAGASPSMEFLVVSRIFQGIGTGGIFALVYVVLSDVSPPGQRPRILSFASSIWGIASLIGPTFGGFMVTWSSWRWIFYINLPLGLISLVSVALFFKEFREKPKTIYLDWLGTLLLSVFILAVLVLAMMGGREFPWYSFQTVLLAIFILVSGMALYRTEKRAKDPILDFEFFKYPSYALGNTIVFCASFSVFALFAYAPLFLQGGLALSPLHVGYAMLSLSIGWSVGAFIVGRVVHWLGQKNAVLTGAVLLIAGSGLTLNFSNTTTMAECFFIFLISGLGMGFISLSTLLIVQDSIAAKDLGIATSFHQFSRTLGGTIGVGVCGGFVTSHLLNRLKDAGKIIPETILGQLQTSMENLLQAEFQALIPPDVRIILQEVVLNSVSTVFTIVFAVSLISLGLALCLPSKEGKKED
ncbi:MAG: MFS transporter [Desulfobacterales bacterium]|nr:MFS transporter [Desulfobacterales bacterium]